MNRNIKLIETTVERVVTETKVTHVEIKLPIDIALKLFNIANYGRQLHRKLDGEDTPDYKIDFQAAQNELGDTLDAVFNSMYGPITATSVWPYAKVKGE